jgi:hypothetical protein
MSLIKPGSKASIPSKADAGAGPDGHLSVSLRGAFSFPWGIAGILITVWAVVLGWEGVSWAFQNGNSLIKDELGNLSWQMHVFWPAFFHLLPHAAYNDRPTGFVLEGFLYNLFGMNYRAQLACFLLVHFANMCLSYLLFRRMKVPVLISVAGVGVLCSLSTTAQTATYLGASFDVLCTFFLLCSTLAILRRNPIMWYVSATAYLLALRSKEFAIGFPFVLLLLVIGDNVKLLSFRSAFVEAARRLWLHFIIFIVFSVTYFSLLQKFVPQQPSVSAYHVEFGLWNILKAMAYYSMLIIGREDRGGSMIALTVLGIVLCYAVVMKHAALLFCIGAYVATLLPVCLLPNIRAPFYVYFPQIFYVLSVCIICSDLIDICVKSFKVRRLALVGVAVLLLSWASVFRTSGYFKDRVHSYWMVRDACANSVRDARKNLGRIGPGSHIYVNSGSELPWFFSTTESCDGIRLLRRDQSIECIVQRPESELLNLYHQDSSEKYFVDYAPGGYLTTRMRSASRPANTGL